jgi:protein involved in polysaccharide export with SLBB domain
MRWQMTHWAVVPFFAVLVGLGLRTTEVKAQSQVGLPAPSAQSSIPSAAVKPSQPVPVAAPIPNAGPQDENYKLGSGDKVRMIVYGENDLGGEYLIDGGGAVQLPLLGQLPAAGMTIHDFEGAVGKKFVAEGYLKDPRVSVEVENYRPFYIIGEVRVPGQYPYVNGMNALNAVALAGGYTYRAADSTIYLRRNGSSKEEKDPADQTTKISPGDIIRVDERIF